MKNRNALNKLKGPFSRLPNKVLSMVGLSSNAKLMFWVMIAQAESFNPSTKFLCDQMQLSKPVVLKTVRELINRNMINRYKMGFKGQISLFKFTNPEDWR